MGDEGQRALAELDALDKRDRDRGVVMASLIGEASRLLSELSKEDDIHAIYLNEINAWFDKERALWQSYQTS